MARVPDTLFTNFTDGQTVHASDYTREREIMRVAINDFDDKVNSVIPANAQEAIAKVPVLEAGLASANAQLEDIAYNVKSYGAKCDGITDDTASIQAAINAAPRESTIIVGNCRLKGSLTVDKSLKFKGRTFINSSFTGASPNSLLYFDNPSVSICINATASISFEDIVVTGYNQALGINVTDATISLNNAVVQSFQRGIKVTRGYYNKLVNSYVGFCDRSFEFDNCYNINFVNMSVQGNIVPIELNNYSNLTMHGGSIENFTADGISLNTSSRVNLFGTYFEGNNQATAVGINMGANTSVIAMGCHVYLTTKKHFIYTVSDGVRILSRNNFFVYPTDTSAVTVYKFKTNPLADNCQVEIAGDNWDTTAGANVVYCETGIFAQNGIYEIHFPPTHPNFTKSISTANDAQKQSLSTPTVEDGTLVTFANAGYVGDDPIGIHTATWGYNPYRAIYQKGQWEKVGLRLPNQTDTTGATLAQLETEINTLKTNLRAAGVMI